MGIKRNSRPSVLPKHSSKRSRLHNRNRIKAQTEMSRDIKKQQAKKSVSPIGVKGLHFKPLIKIFNRRGMAYGRRNILRTSNNDLKLRRKFDKLGIRGREDVEEALLELLFQCRNLRDWDSGGDNLVDVFHLIKGRVKWASEISVDLIMQLFFTLLRARLDCPVNSRKVENSCKVALRIDKVISYINGVDHLFAEYEIYKNLVLPLHHAIRSLPRRAKVPPSAIPGALFLQAISCSNK